MKAGPRKNTFRPGRKVIVGHQTAPLLRLTFVFTLLLNIAAPRAFAWGFSVQSKPEPSVVGAGTFVSLEGRFSIALPQRNQGLRGMSIATPMGRAKGDAYEWSMKEAKFSAGYVDSPQPLDTPEARKQMIASARDGLLATANSLGGKLGSEAEVKSGEYAGSEIRIEFPRGALVNRFYLVSRRLYLVSAVVQTGEAFYEALALGVLNSFKVLSAEEVIQIRNRKP